MKYECGFYAVNKKHCWVNGHCAVCKKIVLESAGWFHIRGRGDVAVIENLPQELDIYDPSEQLLGKQVIIAGKEYTVKGVETYAIPRSKEQPYTKRFSLLV